MSMKSSNDNNWDRTSDFPICSTAPNHCATAVPLEPKETHKYTLFGGWGEVIFKKIHPSGKNPLLARGQATRSAAYMYVYRKCRFSAAEGMC